MKKNKLNTITGSGFKTPKDYFKSLEDNLLQEIKVKEASNKTEFKVPKDYFETLDDKILNTINEKRETKVINLFSWKKTAYIATIAASLIILLNITFSNKNKLTIDNIETASIENYLLSEELETIDIASLFTDEEFSQITFTETIIPSENLDNYIIENIAIEDLITE